MHFIIVRTQVVGYHKWPEAPNEFAYLRELHRHVFHIEARKTVEHPDRAEEINYLAGQIRTIISMRYDSIWYKQDQGAVNFDTESCEMIAEYLGKHFGFDEVIVLEDGVSGGGWHA